MIGNQRMSCSVTDYSKTSMDALTQSSHFWMLHREHVIPYDWGYTLRAEDTLIEIRRQSHSVFVIVWAEAQRDKEAAEVTAETFFQDFQGALRRAGFLFDVRKDAGSDTR